MKLPNGYAFYDFDYDYDLGYDYSGNKTQAGHKQIWPSDNQKK